jgi:hypothetical protein
MGLHPVFLFRSAECSGGGVRLSGCWLQTCKPFFERYGWNEYGSSAAHCADFTAADAPPNFTLR